METNPIIPVPDFAARLREIRIGLGKSRPEMAEALHISKAAVAAYEQRLRRVPATVWHRALYMETQNRAGGADRPSGRHFPQSAANPARV